MNTSTKVLTGIAASLLINGCDPRAENRTGPAIAPTAAQSSSSVPGTPAKTPSSLADGESLVGAIDWQYGDVDTAFQRAAREDKLVFLYWGAAWCPPCHQINQTIFSRPEFIDRSKLFVPVYLDGDTHDAQRAGDRFGVFGYPTMIVLQADGTEITRIPGGIDIERYAEVLDLAMANARPIDTAVHAVLAGDGEPSDFKLLAYYSWEQDNERILEAGSAADTLQQLSARCPDSLAIDCTRLFAAWATHVLDNATPDAPAATAEPLGTHASAIVDGTLAILSSEALSKANHALVFYYSAEVARLLAPGSERRAQLDRAWLSRLDAMAADDSLSVMERLYTVRTRIALARSDDPEAPLSAQLIALARERVAWADANAQTKNQRQSAMNAAWHVLNSAGLEEDANAMLLAEIAKSDQPYYFMSSLASLARRAGDNAGAITWLRRAYDESTGHATRFQWGTNYVRGLIDLAPDDPAAIGAAAVEVLGELDGKPDAFYGRNKSRLERLEKALHEWGGAKHSSTLILVRSKVLALCKSIADGGNEESCPMFLSNATG